MLTKEECLAALKRFGKDKSPGTDGITAAELYSAFWELVGQNLVDSFNLLFVECKYTIAFWEEFEKNTPNQ